MANARRQARKRKQSANTPGGLGADESGYGTSYRTAMSTISAFANANSKSMLPERRKKLAAAKDELRELYGRPQNSKGARDPGQKNEKPKAKSRRNPRTK